jgi:uncharacterized repeat protein (TIGR01451 family)
MQSRKIVFGLALVTALHAVAHGQTRQPQTNVSTAVPTISIQTAVLAEINVGTSTQVAITIKNSGKSPAEGVSIQTALPDSVTFLKATPAPSLTSDRLVQFEIGELPAGSERRVIIELVPQKPGPVDLQTKAFFATSTQSALQVRQSEVVLHCHAPQEVLVGETVTFRVVVENIGDGVARQIILTPQFPAPYRVASSSATEIASLRGGEKQEFQFTARAAEGQWLEANFVATTGDGNQVHCGSRVKIMHPDLQIQITGPRLTFVRKEAEYEIHVWNPGDTTLEGGVVALSLADGLRVTAISDEAHTDGATKTLTWCLPTMPPGASESLLLKAVATKVGAHKQTVVANSAPKLVARDEHLTLVVARADVDLSVSNRFEANEVGTADVFTIRLRNNGSKAAERVDVHALIPEPLLPVGADHYTLDGQRIDFPSLRLGPGEEKTLTFGATSLSAGDYAVRATVQTDFGDIPTSAETNVYFFDHVELDRIAREIDTTKLR